MAAKHLANSTLNLTITGLLLSIDRPNAMVDDGRWSGFTDKRDPFRSDHSAVAGSWPGRQRPREFGALRRGEQLHSGNLIFVTIQYDGCPAGCRSCLTKRRGRRWGRAWAYRPTQANLAVHLCPALRRSEKESDLGAILHQADLGNSSLIAIRIKVA